MIGNETGGLILLFNDNFTANDKTYLSMMATYLAPVLFVFRYAFIQVAQRHFNLIWKAISSFRTEKDISLSLQRVFCEIGNAECCIVLALEKGKNSLGFPVLPHDNYLIRSSIEHQQGSTYLSHRSISEFNPKIDDDPTLPKINSMLVLKVKDSNFVVVLFNSLILTTFSKVQSALVTLFSLSMPPIFHQISLQREVDEMNEKNIREQSENEKNI